MIIPTRCSVCLDSSSTADNPLFSCSICTSVVHRECLRSWDAERGGINIWRWQPAQCVLGHPLAHDIRVRRMWRGQLAWEWTSVWRSSPWSQCDMILFDTCLGLFWVWLFFFVTYWIANGLLWILSFILTAVAEIVATNALWIVTVIMWCILSFAVLFYHGLSVVSGYRYLQFPPRPVYTVMYNKEKES